MRETEKTQAPTVMLDEGQTSRLIDLTARFLAAMNKGVQRQLAGDMFSVLDPNIVTRTLMEAGIHLLSDPARLLDFQMKLWQDQFAIWDRFCQGTLVDTVTVQDSRFRGKDWDGPAFDLLRRSYLSGVKRVSGLMDEIDSMDPEMQRRVRLYTRLISDALSPANFPLTNPKVLQRIEESSGINLLDGFENLVADLERGDGKLAISMVDAQAFTVGVNIAATPGKVVFENRMMQLLQYEPTTDQVYRRPILLIPPWINKYYILDLSAKNSFVSWLTGEGFTVFMVSWVNPDETYKDVGFEDYMLEGPVAALDAIAQATGEKTINILGYCIGGTLLATMLSWLAKRRRKNRVGAVTFLTTLVDFREAGDLRAFIDPEQLDRLDKHMHDRGYMNGEDMSDVFSLLRDNDLIWSFVVNNYFMGKKPPAFDLLYWNGDSTRMPTKMHHFYLNEMYLQNRLCQPNALNIAGSGIDLGRIDWPSCLIAARSDHIAPWRAVFRGTQIFSGDIRFMLADSGHVAGVVNPPGAKKYGYWTGTEQAGEPEDWLASAVRHEGSWWPEWAEWLAGHGGEMVPARRPGDGKLAIIADAPGSYVRG